MSCTRPLTAYWKDKLRSRITFDRGVSLTKVSFKLPCQRCLGCRLEKARQWGMRCMHEKKSHAVSCYVTLTYNDDYLPEPYRITPGGKKIGGSLVVRDLQLFMKRLRKCRAPTKLRFFAGGEYGEDNLRPHFHLLLFGVGFPDMRLHTVNKRGEPLYTSSELSNLWFQGFSTIGEITFDSAVYCAKYAIKKVNGEPAKAHYEFMHEDGIIYDRKPEFALMSRRPGIGRAYYDQYGSEVRAHDSVVFNGREVRPPRYYDNLSMECDEDAFARHKRKRKRMEVLNRSDNTPERLRVKEELMRLAAEKKERKL